MLNGKSILVVDRDPLMREILEDSLQLVDAEVHSAGTLKDALEVLASASIDAVICEDYLERGTGLELLERMKNCELDIPFAIMTGSEQGLCRETLFKAGVSVVFEKPFGLDDFLEGMRLILVNGHSTQSLTDPDSVSRLP
jgi:two-component system response regulator MprA